MERMGKIKAGIVLAAGKGTRMKISYPKVLYPLGGKTLLERLLRTLDQAQLDKIVVVVGFQAQKVRKRVKGFNLQTKIEFAFQAEQLGTGHATKCAKQNFEGLKGGVLVAYGDMPFWSLKTIRQMFRVHEKNKATITLAIAELPKQFTYGRVIIENGKVKAVIEEKDCSLSQLRIKAKNAGLYVFDSVWLFANLDKLSNQNAQREYYLTDLIEIAVKQDKKVVPYFLENSYEAIGVNTKKDIHLAENKLPALRGE